MTYNPKTNNDYRIILAIESSCDETSASIIEDGRNIKSLIISSQIKDHQKYGGVVPEVASRKHVESISYVVDSALKDANVTYDDIDAIAMTKGPGLVGALLVGVSYAKALAFAHNIPMVAVHHINGHISSNYLTHKELEPPYLSLVVSGGHTLLVDCTNYGQYKILGTTRDDAAGEAFDKGARILGYPYPGGKLIDEVAKTGDSAKIRFPRARLKGNQLDFSYSGVKTSLKQYIEKHDKETLAESIADIAASYQEAIVDVMVKNTMLALKATGHNKLSITGGVSANSRLREKMSIHCKENNIKLYLPELRLCCDNAAMIGSAGYYMLKDKLFARLNANAKAYESLDDG